MKAKYSTVQLQRSPIRKKKLRVAARAMTRFLRYIINEIPNPFFPVQCDCADDTRECQGHCMGPVCRAMGCCMVCMPEGAG